MINAKERENGKKSVPVKIGLAGSGKVATHLYFYLSHYLKKSDYSLIRWSRSGSNKAPETVFKECPVILLAISDDSIESFITEHNFPSDVTFIHFSGAKTIPGAVGFHPLMTFSDSLYPLDFYPTIPFVCEKGGVSFTDIFPDLKNPVQTINSEDKALYHALCVLSGNFTALLWAKTETGFAERLGLDPAILAPYRKRQFENIAADPLHSLTGPLLRGDTETIEKNLKALEGDPYRDVYLAFVNAYQKEKL